MPKLKSNKAPKLKKAPNRSKAIEEEAKKHEDTQRRLKKEYLVRQKAKKNLRPNPLSGKSEKGTS